jgi:hypothetical protein
MRPPPTRKTGLVADDHWQRVKQLLGAALERPAEARGSFPREACGGDEGLRREVESLLIDRPAHRRLDRAAPMGRDVRPRDAGRVRRAERRRPADRRRPRREAHRPREGAHRAAADAEPQLQPDVGFTNWHYVVFLFRAGRGREALEHARTALAAAPQDVFTRYAAATAEMIAGSEPRATEIFEQLLPTLRQRPDWHVHTPPAGAITTCRSNSPSSTRCGETGTRQ